MSSSSLPTESSSRRAPGAALLTGLAFALVGVLVHLQTLAERTLPAILAPGPSITFREIVEGLPIPKALDWNQGQIDLLIALRGMGVFPELLFGSLLFGSLWLLTVSILNPTFRLFYREEGRGKREEGREGETIPEWSVDRVHLEQVFRLLLLMAIPLVLVWVATGGWVMSATLHLAGQSKTVNHAGGIALRCMALGICLWFGYHPEGLAGRFGILHRDYQSEETATPVQGRLQPAAWGKLLLTGVLFGLCLYGLISRTMPPPSQEFMACYKALGTFTQNYWNEIALHYIGSNALAWFGAGVLLYLMGRPGLRLGMRAVLLLIPIGAAAVAFVLTLSSSLSALTMRFDATPAVLATAPPSPNPRIPGSGVPEGPVAGRELAQRLHLKTVSEPMQARNMIVFIPRRGPIVTSLGDYSEDYIHLDADGVRKVQAYLEQHHYESALSWVATRYLDHDGALRFDITSQIRICLQDMEYAPHLRQCNQGTRVQLFVCATSPQNRALLDIWADESRFAHPDRASQVLMGDLYLRFGDKEKALAWYRKAEMPSSFLANISAQPPPFHQGRVTGRLLLNGKPLSGVQVGVLPHRLNGVPDDIVPLLYPYWAEAIGMQPYSELFPRYHPRPVALRWISAGTVTGADGSFTLDNLTGGEYFLVCTLPPQISCTVPESPNSPPDPALHIVHAPTPLTLNDSSPSQNVGDIVFTYKK